MSCHPEGLARQGAAFEGSHFLSVGVLFSGTGERGRGWEGGVWAGAPSPQPSRSHREKAHSLGATWERGDREGREVVHWRGLKATKNGTSILSSPASAWLAPPLVPSVRKGEGTPPARPRAWHHALPVLLGPEAGRRDSLLTMTRSPGTTTDRERLQNCSCVRHSILSHQPLQHVSPMSYSFPPRPHPFLPQ